MKIILLEDVKKQGKKGDILEVKDGYGTFLIKNKQAVIASKTGVERLEKQIAEALKEKGFSIDKKQVKEKDSLSSLGYHTVEIELHKKVSAKVSVRLQK